MMLPIVNSPRVGVCGYCGPEDETGDDLDNKDDDDEADEQGRWSREHLPPLTARPWVVRTESVPPVSGPRFRSQNATRSVPFCERDAQVLRCSMMHWPEMVARDRRRAWK
jgi:hypothetical protein